MTERDGYPPGVPCWVDTMRDDPEDAAAELGGKVVMPPYDIPGFRQAVLADPQGAVFSVSQLIVQGA